MTLPARAQIVVVGAGIAGSSVAYHLTQLGRSDVVVLEQGQLVSGTTSHAPGLIGQVRADPGLTRLLMYSVSLYRTLQVDGEPGFFEVGSLRVASSAERLVELRRQAEFAKGLGLACEIISGEEAARHFPLMTTTGVHGALWLPSDGSATAPILARAMLAAAQARGARVMPRVRVDAVEVVGGEIRALETSQGRIETETVVAATGIWSARIGALAGVPLPLVPLQHQYVVTDDLPELADRRVANIRDPDKLVYVRQRGAGLAIGAFEYNGRAFPAEQIPDNSNPDVRDCTVRPFDEQQFSPLLAAAAERIPCLAGAALSVRVNGLESFTPDGEFLLGPSPRVRGFFAACGFCAHGVSGAGGVGRAVAEWIVEGRPSLDLEHLSIARFDARPPTLDEIREGALRAYGAYYALRGPS